MRRWVGVVAGCALVASFAAHASGQSAPSGSDAAWLQRVRAAASARGFQGGAQSILVVERASGVELFAKNAERALAPASTQKVLTALAALEAFGAGYQFVTEVFAPAPPGADGVVASLAIRGADPAMTGEQWWRLAHDLRALGVAEVAGGIALDDSLLDAERWHPSWQPVSARAYHAPIGAMSANYGAFRVVVSPGASVGAAARVLVDPPLAYFPLTSTVRTGRPGGGASITVGRAQDAAGAAERVSVGGSIALGADRVEIWRSVIDPTAYAAAVLGEQLAAAGIRVRGAIARGNVPADAHPLYEFKGLPLRTTADLLLKYSNNFIAEALLKQLGHLDTGEPGSWKNGAAALRARLAALGLPLAGCAIVDGSGLSRDDRVSARLLVGALRSADRSFAVGPDLLAGLPIAAEDGTLRTRAEGARGLVRAKTGTLDGVTALAGWARTLRGREVVFAVISNGHRHGDVEAIAAIDAFATALVQDENPPD
ncbi:MAG TPA: D-alanyl-D-alanine carboxypeptidase/D-alanyl-D-alanine-endopeptidase [Myxococcota bacterium]|jgi:D-alanyl-D-alanine carboxypeptidase/D-alanyl-D-alanine-endopeptidase (penicillin-binding protein 4)